MNRIAFEFATAGRILFGEGKAAEAAKATAAYGDRVLVITGSNPDRAQALIESLNDHEIEWDTFALSGEPTVEQAREGASMAYHQGCRAIIGFGGGSVIDAAKAIAALATNPGDPLDYLEVIGQGRPLTVDPLPCVAIPTTAGTGAEVTRNAVLASKEHRVKVSLRHHKMLPALAIVDPELTYSTPPAVTAASGMDALAQVLEPLVSVKASPLTDAICREGLAHAARSLRRVAEDGSDRDARRDMALTSLFGGLALANSGLGAAHGFAGPLGGMYDGAPHGAIVAALLPAVMRANIAALRERQPESDSLHRYAEIARILTRDPAATADDGAAWVQATRDALHIPGLSTYGVQPNDFPAIIEKAQRSSSMKGNPLPLTDAELAGILRESV